MLTQQNKRIALSCLSCFDSEYEVVQPQILSSKKVDNLTDFSWLSSHPLWKHTLLLLTMIPLTAQL